MLKIKQQLSILAFSLLFLPLALSAQTTETCNSTQNCRSIVQNGSGHALYTYMKKPGYAHYSTAKNTTGAGKIRAGYFWATAGNGFSNGASLETRTTGTGLKGLHVVMDANTDGSGAQVLQNGSGWTGFFTGGRGFYSDRMAIGTDANDDYTQYTLAVGGDMVAERVLVRLENTWPDYVFADNYDLSDLTDVEQFIQKNKHLPHLPSAASIEESGEVDLVDIQSRLLRTIEELTLHIIEQGKEIESLKNAIEPKQ